MKERKIDSSMLDKAVNFAVSRHAGTERRGKGFPYIVHPMEVVSIVATMTADQELLAAAVLHDVVEDTDCTLEDIRAMFGDKVARVVEMESTTQIEGIPESLSWKARRVDAINRLKTAPLDCKMVALGDKLSNMRAIARDYKDMGIGFFSRFHESNPKEHEWYYRGLADSLKDLDYTDAYKEFVELIDCTFSTVNGEKGGVKAAGGEIEAAGSVGKKEADKIIELVGKGYGVVNFDKVTGVSFAALRRLKNARDSGLRFVLRNVSAPVAATLDTTGVSSIISFTKKTSPVDMKGAVKSGDGYTADTFYSADGDALIKLYYNYIPKELAEKEKRYARAAFLLGINTPLSGEIINSNGRAGIVFEKITNKRSVARIISEEPARLTEMAETFAAQSIKLHSTECDLSVFPSEKKIILSEIKKIPGGVFSADELNRIESYVESIPDAVTCLHGDFHIGNMIIAAGEPLWIDMGDFAYGNPLFDLGSLYFVSHSNDDGISENLFHFSAEELRTFWNEFSTRYFAGRGLSQKEIDGLIRPFAAIRAILLGGRMKWQPWMKEYVLQNMFAE